MSFVDRLRCHVSQHSRRVSTGEVVITTAGLQALPMLSGSRKKLPHKFMNAIQLAELRRGEYDITATRDALIFLGVDVQRTWDALSGEFAATRVDQIVGPVVAEEEPGVVVEIDHKSRMDRYIHEYADHTHRELVVELVGRDDHVDVLNQRLALAYKRTAKLHKIIQRSQKSSSEEPTPSKLELERNSSGNGTRLTDSGQYALAIRRNMSNIACSDLGAVLLEDDINRWRVARCEIGSAAALMASARHYWECESQALTDNVKFGLSVSSITSDATNGGMFKRSKLSTCEVDSTFLGWERDSAGELVPVAHSMKRHCDVVPVCNSITAGTMSVLLKHLKSIGMPSWREAPNRLSSVRVLLYTGDRGPHQVCSRKRMKAECLRQMNVLFIDADCTEHCLHLIVKDALKIVDGFLVDIGKTWKYYSTLTKVAQLWRDNAGDVFKEWSNRYGQADAAKHMKTLCPQCVAGRWGSVAATENRLETIGIDRLHIVLSAVMVAKKSKGAAGSDHPPLKGPDEISHDEMQAYRLKMGRWARDVIHSTSDMLFARVVAVMHRACAPILHCSNLVKQIVPAEDELVYGCRMAQLISWDGARIAKEFDDLMLDPFLAIASDGLPETEAERLQSFAAKLVIQNASGYNRRVMKQLTTDPLVLLNLGARPPDQDCHLRRQVSTRLLNTPDIALEADACKLKQLFAEDLALASATGTCGSELYTTMLLARKH